MPQIYDMGPTALLPYRAEDLYIYIYIYIYTYTYILFFAETRHYNIKVLSCGVIFGMYSFRQCLNLCSAKYSESEC